MIRKYNKNFILLLISDTLIILGSIYLSVLFRFDFIVPAVFESLFSFKNLIFIMTIKIISFKIFRLYRGMWRFTSVWDMLNIIKANIFSSIIMHIGVYIFIGFSSISRSLLIIDFMICTGLVGFSRLGIRMFFQYIKDFVNVNESTHLIKKRILIIGAGSTGHLISSQLLQKKSLKFIVAFLDDDLSKIGKRLNGIEVIGTTESILEIKFQYDEIYICVPSANSIQMRKIVNFCKKTSKPFKTLPSISELVEGKVSVSQLRKVSPVDLLGRKEIILDKSSIRSFIEGKRVLVTGAGGSIGSELVRQCINYNPSLLLMIDVSELNLFQIEQETSIISSSILFKPILLDIKDEASLENIFKEYKPQVVFHAAAYKHVPIQEHFPQEAIKTNIFGTLKVVSAAIKYNVEKFVLVSTDKAVRPTNVMGATKRIAEMICQSSNEETSTTQFMSVRFGNVLGSSGSVIPIFQRQIENGGPLTITDPDMERYFMSIPEASQLILQTGAIGVGGGVYILDMGQPVKIINLAKDLIRLSGLEPDNDIEIKVTGARPGEKKIEELSLHSETLDQTKHEKIFVLKDSDINHVNLKSKLNEILLIEKKLIGKSPDDIKKELAKLLPDYNPGQSIFSVNYKEKKVEA